jgi:hypothetical protein
MSTRSQPLVPLILCFALNGCSFVFVDGPPSAHASMPQFSCDESKAWPIVDAVFAATGVVGVVTAKEHVETRTDGWFCLFCQTYQDTTSTAEVIAAALTTVALYGSSAFIGNRRVNRCRSAMAELARRSEAASLLLCVAPYPSHRGPSPAVEARLVGLEPTTFGLEGRCSIQLSYRRQ